MTSHTPHSHRAAKIHLRRDLLVGHTLGIAHRREACAVFGELDSEAILLAAGKDVCTVVRIAADTAVHQLGDTLRIKPVVV